MTMTTPRTDSPPGPTAEAYAEQVFGAALGTVQTFAAYAGDRLGWYRALADDGPATAAELATRTGTHERYCLEWLELQAVFGTLTAAPATDRGGRRFALPAGPAEVLTDEGSLNYLGALPRFFAAAGLRLQDLLAAYRDGGGVSWAEFGDDARQAQAALNRPLFDSQLGPALAAVPQVHESLSAPGSRIADIGCGARWSTLALARAYPQAELVGFDIDQPSVDMARAAAVAAGLGDRVTFTLAEGESLSEHDVFDAAFLFECLHDMPRPVQVLTAVRESVRPGGPVVVMDEAVADDFHAPADDVDRIMYGYSMFVCLPDGMSSTPSTGTGTVIRRSILTDYARQAGFTEVDVLPIEDFGFFRFYRLAG